MRLRGSGWLPGSSALLLECRSSGLRHRFNARQSKGQPKEGAMPYDLLLKGGHVLDPGQNLDGTLDIAISDGKIAAIQPDIAATEARRTVEIRGANRYVLPGLVDIHNHVAYGAQTPGVGM